jgi:hypothetical protein
MEKKKKEGPRFLWITVTEKPQTFLFSASRAEKTAEIDREN